MLTHEGIWQAIDRLAKKYAKSASGLAKVAGLDPTTFNKSKRFSRNGKPRWPSTESLSKVLAATGASLHEFVGLTGAEVNAGGRIPVIGLVQAGAAGYFDDAGLPTGQGWDEVDVIDLHEPGLYALEIAGDSMLPAYRDGTLIVVSPHAAVRRGDRVVVKTTNGEVMAKLLARQTAHKIELASLNTDHPDRSLDTEHVLWMRRIIWASQ